VLAVRTHAMSGQHQQRRPEQPHATTQQQAAASVDDAALIERSGCAAELEALDECMGAHNRAWSKCQSEVRALAKCKKGAADKE
jgi:hypothetical protein